MAGDFCAPSATLAEMSEVQTWQWNTTIGSDEVHTDPLNVRPL
jgi:hypothetical protein